MSIRFKKSASVAFLAIASAAPLYADGGQWSNRFWGLGWGDGYHAPPQTGGIVKGLGAHGHRHGGGHEHGSAQHVPAFAQAGEQPGVLMPGGYPDRGQYHDAPRGPRLPQWLWDPSDETVIVESAPASLPQEADPVPPPPELPAAAKPAKDPSLGMPPALEPESRTDARAMRRGLIQARWNGESR
ncbi:MAG TPA: hypothetical protein VGN57_14365 [Pirellulaceae bacterium]|jgi:hypothetical protein|nr:hypothetical protein [Pirellulaceae bacterium]